MMALSRIAAIPDGTSPPVGARRPLKATRDSITPFLEMLSALSPGKAGKTAEAKGQVAPAPEQSTARTKLPGRNDTLARSRHEPATSGLAVNDRVADRTKPQSQDLDRTGLPNDKSLKAKTASVHGDDEGRLGSIAAASSLGGLAEPRINPNRNHAVATGAGTRGTNEQSGIEVTGTGSVAGKDGARVSIVDLRLKARGDGPARREGGRSGNDGDQSAGSSKAERATAGAQVESDPSLSAGRLSLSVEARADNAAPAPNASGQAASRSFTESLASRLRDGAADIVRSAQVVLRDGGLGMIRLRLEPESLGGVKIELKLAEKQISGKIVVESDIAGEAFRSSLDALKDAFAECGFETTSLEVEVRNGMASGTGPDGHHPGEAGMDEGPYWSRSLRELDAAVPAFASGGRDGLLNVIV